MKQTGREVVGRQSLGQVLTQIACETDSMPLQKGYVLVIHFTDEDLSKLMIDLVLSRTFSAVGLAIGNVLLPLVTPESCPTCKRPYYHE